MAQGRPFEGDWRVHLQNLLAVIASVEFLVGIAVFLLDKRLPSLPQVPWIGIALPSGSISLLSIITIFLLAVTVAPTVAPDELVTGSRLFTATVFAVPIIYRFTEKIWHFIVILIGIFVLVWIYTAIKYDSSMSEGINEAAVYLNIGALLGMGTGVLLELRFAPSITVAILSSYYLITRFKRLRKGQVIGVGVSARLYSPLMSLVASPTGVASTSLIFVSMVWVINIVPNILVAPMSTPASVRNLLLFTSVIGLPFFVALFTYWLFWLRRLPNSVQYWESGSHFQFEREKEAPQRPKVRHFLIPFLGWQIAVGPQWSARVSGFSVADNGIVPIVYLLVLLGMSLLSCSLFSEGLRHSYLRFAKDPITIKSDHKALAISYGLILLAVSHGAIVIRDTPFDIIYLLLVLVIWCCEWKGNDQVGYDVMGVIAAGVIISLPYLIPTRSVYWEFLIFLAVGYLGLRVSLLFDATPISR